MPTPEPGQDAREHIDMRPALDEALAPYVKSQQWRFTLVAAVLGVLPVYRAQVEREVRAELAKELHERAAEYADTLTGPRASFRRGMLAAAHHIAPDPTPQEIVDAINSGNFITCRPAEEPAKEGE